MKTWLFRILISFCLLVSFPSKKSNAENWVSIMSDIASYIGGNGLVEWCSGRIGCDEYEDTSLTDEVTGLFSGYKKESVCAINSAVKNITRIGGTAFATALGIPPPASYIAANLTGQSLQCLQAWALSSGVKRKIDKYELCYGSSSEGHPMPLTDKQIAKILPKVNLFPTVENIVDQYSKLCIKKTADESSYKFYDEGDYFDGVYVHHASGYAYLLCASLFEACPCVFNIQNGKINDPEYEREEETGFIKMRPDGSLIHKGDTENDYSNQKKYEDRYAKHCRLIRFKEVYEQSNDLASIYSDACFDLHGYSKRQANITVGIVQCFEDTARNIFEKPILSSSQVNSDNYNSYGTYTEDHNFIYKKYEKIQNLLQGRTEENINSSELPAFLPSDRNKILQLLQDIWYTKDSTSIIGFSCTQNGSPIYSGYKTSIHNKYVVSPVTYSTANCCSTNSDIYKTCYSDKYESIDGVINIAPSVTEEQDDITLEVMFEEIKKVGALIKHIENLEIKASDAESVQVNDSGITLTLFDLLRNKIKVLAVIALAFWSFLFSWKMINGDYGKINVQEFGSIALKVFLCYMVIFDNSTKNLIFNFSIKTAQGVGMFFNEVMEDFRSRQDNKYNNVCNMRQNYRNSPSKKYREIINADSVSEDKYICQNWEKKVCKYSGDTEISCSCNEYKMLCSNEYPNLNCSEYFTDYDGSENRNYCKIGTCSSSSGSIDAKIYETGVSRVADQYQSYTFTCPADSDDNGCVEYKTFFGKKQCVKKECKKFSLLCDVGSNLSCRKYNILPDGSDGECVSGVCVSDKTTFVPMPPVERPYKIKSYYNAGGSEMTFQPYCHKKPDNDSLLPSYRIDDPEADGRKYSVTTGAEVFVCEDGYELDDGFRIKEYIRHGIVPSTKEGVLVFQSLLPPEKEKASDDEKYNILLNIPVPTAVATVDSHGLVREYSFIDDNNASEGFQRAKYRTYIKSLLYYTNKNSTYPKINEYGYTRDYSHLSFWDSMDCKIIQFISLQGMDSGFTDDMESVISSARESSGKIVTSALNGMLQILKFVLMSFPFGILIFILMFGIGAALFMLVARAAQQYCLCVFHLVLLVYLSPFVFLLWLFDQTKNAFDTWISDMKNNIFGACIPFVSISMFLFIIDWLLFGDVTKYVSMELFLPSGEINDNCYNDHLNEAPIACLTKRCLKTFTWLGIFGLNQGVSLYSSQAFKMFGYLVLRCLFAGAIIIAMTSILDKMENAIYKIIGAKPSMEIDAGFNYKAGDAIHGLSAGKIALGSAVSTVKLSTQVASKIVKWILPGKALDKISDAANYIPNKIKEAQDSMSKSFAETFNTKSWRDHQQRLNDIDNEYNQSMNSQREIRDRKIQDIRDRSAQQQRDNASAVEAYGRELEQRNMFSEQQISELKRQKEVELANQVNRVVQDGIANINREFDQAQNEIVRIRDESKKKEDDNF